MVAKSLKPGETILNQDVIFALNSVKQALAVYQPKVYLFGSRAIGTHTARSDIDIAVSSAQVIPPREMSAVRETLEQSNLLYSVDLIDMATASDVLKQKILEQGCLWNG